jgi:hypothetical protein
VLADDRDHLILGVEDLLHIDRPVFEAFDPLREPLVGFIEPHAPLRIDSSPKRRRVPDEVGMADLRQQLPGSCDVLEATPEQVEVLLRHRPPSISRGQRRGPLGGGPHRSS